MFWSVRLRQSHISQAGLELSVARNDHEFSSDLQVSSLQNAKIADLGYHSD